jgi:hypothetical protein
VRLDSNPIYFPAQRSVHDGVFVHPSTVPTQLQSSNYDAERYAAERNAAIIMRGKSHLNFITCAGSSEYVSFTTFAQPFTAAFWEVALPSFVATSVFIFFVFKYFKLKDSTPFFVIKVLLLQRLGISPKLGKLYGFKLFLGPFLLIIAILTNLYRGELTSDMTEPLPRVQLQTVQEAINSGFKILVHIKPRYKEDNDIHNYNRNRRNLDLKWKMFKNHLKTTDPFIRALILDLGESSDWVNYPKLLDSMTPVISDYTGKSNLDTLDSELLKCDNSILIGEPLELEMKMIKLIKSGHVASKYLYMGKDNYLPINSFWMMGPLLFDRQKIVYTQFQAVIHSGIFKLIMEGVDTDVHIMKKALRIRNSKLEVVEPISLKSGLVLGIFILFSVCILASALFLLLERQLQVFIIFFAW